MIIATDDPRLMRIDARVQQLGLTQEQALSCLLHAVHAYGGERGRLAVQYLREQHEADERWIFCFDDLALMAGVTPAHLLNLLETGVAEFGERFASKRMVLQ